MRLIVLALAALLAVAAASNDKKVVCYYGSWAKWRQGHGKFDAADIDPTLCTHVVYSFALPTENADGGIKPLEDLSGFLALKKRNPKLKLMIAIGGFNEGSHRFSKIAADPAIRKKFAQNVYDLLKKHNLDGFDVDWEYPARSDTGGVPADKANYVLLLKALKEKLAPAGLLLSAAVGLTQWAVETSYDVPQIAKQLDFINLMAYDVHGSWESSLGIHAPLYAGSWENDKNANIDAAVKFWIQSGAPAQKLILGAPLYGKGWTVAGSTKPGSPSAGASLAGPYTKEAGTLNYNEICQKIKNEKWEVKFEKEQRVPYAFKDNQWVGFDNERSLAEKAEYVNKKGLGGVMVWSMEGDDFKGICGGPKYPLMRAINRALKVSINEPESPEPATSYNSVESNAIEPQDEPVNAPPSVNEPSYDTPAQYNPQSQSIEENEVAEEGSEDVPQTGSDDVCQQDGYIQDPQNSGNYYYCQRFNGEFLKYQFQCPAGLVYDTCLGVCNWSQSSC